MLIGRGAALEGPGLAHGRARDRRAGRGVRDAPEELDAGLEREVERGRTVRVERRFRAPPHAALGVGGPHAHRIAPGHFELVAAVARAAREAFVERGRTSADDAHLGPGHGLAAARDAAAQDARRAQHEFDGLARVMVGRARAQQAQRGREVAGLAGAQREGESTLGIRGRAGLLLSRAVEREVEQAEGAELAARELDSRSGDGCSLHVEHATPQARRLDRGRDFHRSRGCLRRNGRGVRARRCRLQRLERRAHGRRQRRRRRRKRAWRARRGHERTEADETDECSHEQHGTSRREGDRPRRRARTSFGDGPRRHGELGRARQHVLAHGRVAAHVAREERRGRQARRQCAPQELEPAKDLHAHRAGRALEALRDVDRARALQQVRREHVRVGRG